MGMPPELTEAGVMLRPLGEDDIEMVRLWRNRDDVRRWFRHSEPITEKDQQVWFVNYVARESDFIWIIEDVRHPGRAVGQVSVYALDRERRCAELGRIIAAPEARGQGYMFSACRAVIRHCFDTLQLDSLSLDVFAENVPALRLYRQCGFRVTEEGESLVRMELQRCWPEALRPAHPPHPAKTVWLASYPKSGNTWMRIFLANLTYAGEVPVDINSLSLGTPLSASRPEFDYHLGVPSAFLLPEEIERLRPAADQALAGQWTAPVLLRKAHDAYTCLPDGQPMMGQAPDFAAIYVLRDPCDVAVSVANHWGITLGEAASRLLCGNVTLADSRLGLSSQFPQRILSWREHVASWLKAPMPVHVMRYEDMQRQPLKCFRAAIRFLGYDHDDDAITTALEASRFENLQQQEAKSGFRESPAGRCFFRSGRSGEGADLLSADHRQALSDACSAVAPMLQARGF